MDLTFWSLKVQHKGIPEIMLFRILVFMWSFGCRLAEQAPRIQGRHFGASTNFGGAPLSRPLAAFPTCECTYINVYIYMVCICVYVYFHIYIYIHIHIII